VDGGELASAIGVVEGFWKRLLTSNFLTDEASDNAAVDDLVGFVVTGAVVGRLPTGTTASETGTTNGEPEVVAAKLSSINPKVTLKSK